MIPTRPRKRLPWPRRSGLAGAVIVAVYGLLVVVTEASGVVFLCVVAAVVVLDAVLLVQTARRRSRRGAIWCAVAASFAALMQAIWVCIPFVSDVLGPHGDGLVWFGSGLAVALLVGVALLARRSSRPLGWAVLLGSAQGFVASFVVMLAALMAAIGAD